MGMRQRPSIASAGAHDPCPAAAVAAACSRAACSPSSLRRLRSSNRWRALPTAASSLRFSLTPTSRAASRSCSSLCWRSCSSANCERRSASVRALISRADDASPTRREVTNPAGLDEPSAARATAPGSGGGGARLGRMLSPGVRSERSSTTSPESLSSTARPLSSASLIACWSPSRVAESSAAGGGGAAGPWTGRWIVRLVGGGGVAAAASDAATAASCACDDRSRYDE